MAGAAGVSAIGGGAADPVVGCDPAAAATRDSDVEARMYCCRSGAGFRKVSVRRLRPSGVRLGFVRRESRPVRIDVYRRSRGRRVFRHGRRVARFRRLTRSRRWRARPRGRRLRRGYYVVRYRMAVPGSRTDVRRVAFERTRRGFRRRPRFERAPGCGLLARHRLSGPVFGGRTRRPLRIAYRLSRTARVSVRVKRGRRTVRRFRTRRRRAGRTYSLRLPARRLRRGRYRVVLRARAGRRKVRSILTSRRL